MWFNSFGFWLFFAVVVLGYVVLSHRWQNRWLLLAGWVHYLAFDLLIGAWEVRTARREGMVAAAMAPPPAVIGTLPPLLRCCRFCTY